MSHATRVKICGITRPADRDVAVAAGADAIGVIVDVPVDTPRELTVERARELVDGIPPFVTAVLVTMPDSVQDAVALQQDVGADAVQVHGGLDPEMVGGLRARLDVPVVAAVDADAPDVSEYASVADAVLVDSTDDSGGGGTGETHDWEQSRAHVDSLDVPVVLAGGLTAGNVASAISAVRPFGVDTATGVEAAGGVKDHDEVRSFVETARSLEGLA